MKEAVAASWPWAVAFAVVGCAFAAASAPPYQPGPDAHVECIKMRGSWSVWSGNCSFQEASSKLKD